MIPNCDFDVALHTLVCQFHAVSGVKMFDLTLLYVVHTELVETSNNLSSIKLTNSNQHSACYSIVTSTRSSLSHALEVSRNKIATAATVCGAEVIKGNAYAGWAPNTQSPVLQVGDQ